LISAKGCTSKCIVLKNTDLSQFCNHHLCEIVHYFQTQADWPLMVPGDGIDNDNDGEIDEEECGE
jgi:hypothetical protein